MALGKIKADTLEHSTAGALDTSYVVRGSAKTWQVWDGTGSSLSDSVNTSSLTDNGTADYTMSYSSSFSSVNYTHGGNAANSSNSTAMYDVQAKEKSVILTGSIRLTILYSTTSSGAAEYPYGCNVSDGDLA